MPRYCLHLREEQKKICLKLIAFALFIWLGISPAQAQFPTDPRFQANVFGSMVVATQDAENIGLVRDYEQRHGLERGTLSFTDETNIGMQFSLEYSKIKGVVQFVGRNRVHDDFKHLIGYAYLDYTLSDSFTLRGGKIPFEHYLNSDTRAVGYTRLTVRPIPEFYTLLFTESFNGINLKYKTALDTGWFWAAVFGGSQGAYLPTEETYAHSYSYDPLAGAVFTWETLSGKLTASYMWAAIRGFSGKYPEFSSYWKMMPRDIFPDAHIMTEAFEADGSDIHYFSLGVSKDIDSWRLQSEVNYVLFPAIGDMEMFSGYVSAGYQIGKWTPYLVLAGSSTQKNDVRLEAASLAILPEEAQKAVLVSTETFNNIAANQVSMGVGLRWDFKPGMALTCEWNHYRVDEHGTLLWRDISDEAQDGGNVNVVSLSLDFAF